MAGFYNLDHKEVIRINVKKYDGKMQPESKKFSIDPQITSFEMLQGILARAFEIRSDFTISYLARDTEGQTVFLSMLSDWDMDAAFQCAADPCLKLKVDLRPFEEELEDWDVIAPAEIPHPRISSLLDKGSILGQISHGIGKTMNMITKGLKSTDNEIKPLKPPMSDQEFHLYLDTAGYMIRPNEFRLSIYQGGLEPSLRRVAWRHLLNIFPANMSGNERYSYMKRKEEEYRKLREEWKERFKNNTATEEVKYVASMVKKDVLRTDRGHDFYKGDGDNEDNENTLSLFHLLVTYALTHPDVSYCQGMSDLASPLLVTQKDEAQAYICFCSLMNRLRENFTVEGSAIMTKFRHLSELMSIYDPPLHAYLDQNSAGDMFFCYRWFLLEMKREFPFSDALYVLEVMWATLPPSPPEKELALVDPDYSGRLLSTSPCSPTFSIQQAMYAKLLAMRRVGALHRMAQKPKSLPVPQDPSKNSLSPDTSPGLDSSQETSARSSFDHSPCSNFPEVDNDLTRSLQKKSDTIDLVLREGLSFDDEVQGDTEVNKDMCNSQGTGLNKQTLSTISQQNGLDHTALLENHSDYGSDKFPIPSESIPIEETSDFHFTTSASCDRSWSASSVLSDSSDGQDQQVQFDLSLEVNANNSAEINRHEDQKIIPPGVEPINGINTKSEAINSKNDATLNSDSHSGIFQSMKRLLSSPIRRSNQTSTDTSPTTTSPKKTLTKQEPATSGVQGLGNQKDSLSIVKNSSDTHLSDCQEATESLESSIGSWQTPSSLLGTKIRDPSRLPPPQMFGAGNPFLMFLCLTLLTMHRDTIIRSGMCYEEIAMHFDRLVRRHNALRVLHHTRIVYGEYLKAQQANVEREKEKDTEDLGMSC